MELFKFQFEFEWNIKDFFRIVQAWSFIYDQFEFKSVTVMQPALRDNHKFREENVREFVAEVNLRHQ